MTIEITKPEVEALIQQRLRSGAFSDAEDVIFQALRSALGRLTGADLVAAMQASPYKETNIGACADGAGKWPGLS